MVEKTHTPHMCTCSTPREHSGSPSLNLIQLPISFYLFPVESKGMPTVTQPEPRSLAFLDAWPCTQPAIVMGLTTWLLPSQPRAPQALLPPSTGTPPPTHLLAVVSLSRLALTTHPGLTLSCKSSAQNIYGVYREGGCTGRQTATHKMR